MYRSVSMSAIEGPDFCQPKIRNFSNIYKFHQPTRCNSCCCSTKRDPTAHLRRPAVQYGPGQLYAVQRLMTRAAQKRHSHLIPVVNSPVRPQLCRLPRRLCLVPIAVQPKNTIMHLVQPIGASPERLVTNWSSPHHWPRLPLSISYLLIFLVTNWTSRF